MTPIVVLTGFMGSGKSTVGQALSDALGVPFIDTDSELERRAGRSVADIFATDGEQAFRAVETETVTDVLTTSNGIVSLGGGSATVPAIVAALGDHHVVYLEISADNGYARVAGSDRPLIAGENPAGRYAELLAMRAATYRSIAKQTVDASAPVAQLVSTIIKGLPDAGWYASTPGDQA